MMFKKMGIGIAQGRIGQHQSQQHEDAKHNSALTFAVKELQSGYDKPVF